MPPRPGKSSLGRVGQRPRKHLFFFALCLFIYYYYYYYYFGGEGCLCFVFLGGEGWLCVSVFFFWGGSGGFVEFSTLVGVRGSWGVLQHIRPDGPTSTKTWLMGINHLVSINGPTFHPSNWQHRGQFQPAGIREEINSHLVCFSSFISAPGHMTHQESPKTIGQHRSFVPWVADSDRSHGCVSTFDGFTHKSSNNTGVLEGGKKVP